MWWVLCSRSSDRIAFVGLDGLGARSECGSHTAAVKGVDDCSGGHHNAADGDGAAVTAADGAPAWWHYVRRGWSVRNVRRCNCRLQLFPVIVVEVSFPPALRVSRVVWKSRRGFILIFIRSRERAQRNVALDVGFWIKLGRNWNHLCVLMSHWRDCNKP